MSETIMSETIMSETIMSETTSAPVRKQRRARPQFSCAECRRLKLKCDRQVPCANCVRRDCADLCPSGVRPVRPQPNDSTTLKERLQALEEYITQHGMRIPSSSGTHQRPDKRPRVEERENEPSNTYEVDKDASGGHSLQQLDPPVIESNEISTFRTIDDAAVNHPGIPVPGSPTDRSQLDSVARHSLPLWTYDPGRDMQSFLPVADVANAASPHGVRFDYNIPTGSSHAETSSLARDTQSVADGTENPGAGTLLMGRGGRSKYLGPTAASEWLKDSELPDSIESPMMSRMPSPDTMAHLESDERPVSLFPFGSSGQRLSSSQLYAKLPPKSEASAAIEAFYRSFAWHYDVAPRPAFQKVFEAVYRQRQTRSRNPGSPAPPLSDLQDLALVFVTLAHGCLHSLELPPNDPVAETFAASARAALSKGEFLSMPTISGIQSLHILAHYQLETEQGRNGDTTWPLWGMAMRQILAMGIHRDGVKWDLEPAIVQQRRRVFWECQAADVFQANCFSRPSSLWPGSYDTAYPSEPEDDDIEPNQKGFFTLKFDLSKLSCSILAAATRVEAAPYSHILDLQEELSEFERAVPFRLRCRAAMAFLPSVYPDPATAVRESPVPINRNLRLSFQQFTLAINICETVLFLHRPYFARALHARRHDATRTEFGPSYLAVVERSSAIIQCVTALHQMHRLVTCRHWALWYHAFNSAVCLGTLVINNPSDPLAPFAMTQIEAAIKVYTSAVQSGSTSRLIKNLQWLIRLRTRAAEELQRPRGTAQSSDNLASPVDPVEVELLGWRTRLIQRGAHGSTHTATTIGGTAETPNKGISPQTAVDNTLFQALQQHFSETARRTDLSQTLAPATMTVDSHQPDPQATATDSLLHSFWDPMMLQDFPDVGSDALSNWWDMLPSGCHEADPRA